MAEIDAQAVAWLNQWVGVFPWLDAVVRVVISDYFVPVLFSIILLGLWFSGETRAVREHMQRWVGVAAASMGLVNLWVKLLNLAFFRPRPFTELELNLLFYRPTDSSFPANPSAVAFAAATAVWFANRKAGAAMMAVAVMLSLGRVYAGVFYPTDVVGGALIGVAAVYLMAGFFRLIEPVPTLTLRVMRTLRLA